MSSDFCRMPAPREPGFLSPVLTERQAISILQFPVKEVIQGPFVPRSRSDFIDIRRQMHGRLSFVTGKA